MRNLSLELFRDGEIVSPYRTMRMFENLRRNTERVQAKRYYHSMCRIPFDDIDNTDGTAEKQIYIRPPFDVNIDFVELRVKGTADKTFTVSATGITNWANIQVTADGATLVETLANNQCSIDANTECVFTISADGTWSIEVAELILHIRKDRGNAATAFDKPAIASGGQSNVDTQVKQPFDTYDTLVGEEVAASQGGAFTVDVFRNITGSASYSAYAKRHMSVGQYVHSIDRYLVATASVSWTFTTTLPASSAALVSTGTANTVKSQANALGTLKAANINAANDYTFSVSTASAASTGQKLYLVTYYT